MAVNSFDELPAGFRFDPSDDELVDIFLMKKVHNQPLPLHDIQEFDVCQTEPWMLPRDNRASLENRRYYFFDISNCSFQNMDTRAAGNGEWRIIENNKDLALPNNHFIGRKNTLVYWRKKGNQFVKTQWMMHEFHIARIVEPNKKIITPTVIDLTVENASVSARPPPSP
uniref:NAC family transcription factor n=1 Tax=Melilotus albus TaxID=47082 RepID=A0A896WFT3_MELAB|nr:NAC family transcription factor [Melilotus albus]QSD99840.1 NAC family transcription factor [Melilotus albus]